MRQRVLVLTAVAVAAVAVGCNNGSTTVPGFFTGTPAPTSVSTTLPIPTAGGTLLLPPIGGFTETFQVSAGAPANDALTATEFLNAPPNAPAPSQAARRVRAVAGAVPFFWVTFSVAQTTPIGVFTSETFTLPSSLPANARYFLELDDITTPPAVKIATLGPFAVTNGTLVAGNGGGVTQGAIASGRTFLVLVYYVP